MVAMEFPSRQSESLVLCGRTEAADAITVVFGENSGRFDAAASRFKKKVEGRSIARVQTQSNSNRVAGGWEGGSGDTTFLQSKRD